MTPPFSAPYWCTAKQHGCTRRSSNSKPLRYLCSMLTDGTSTPSCTWKYCHIVCAVRATCRFAWGALWLGCCWMIPMQDSQTKESATSVSRAGMLMRFPEHISTTLQPLDWNIIRKVYGHLEREMEGWHLAWTNSKKLCLQWSKMFWIVYVGKDWRMSCYNGAYEPVLADVHIIYLNSEENTSNKRTACYSWHIQIDTEGTNSKLDSYRSVCQAQGFHSCRTVFTIMTWQFNR